MTLEDIWNNSLLKIEEKKSRGDTKMLVSRLTYCEIRIFPVNNLLITFTTGKKKGG